MPQIEKHKPGSFSWIELGTQDQNAAKDFYSALFGWNAQDQPMGPGDFYTIFKLDGRDAAAAYTLRPGEREAGVPPHWTLYVSVENADETAKRATELGGKICAGPFDVFDAGRMAMLFDPAGASFAIFQPRLNQGMQVSAEPAAFCWADLNTPDAAKASAFYSGLFGWAMMPGETGYLHIRNGEAYIGGIPPGEHRDLNAPPHWLVYIQVAECAASASKAKQLGARIYFGPKFIENVGHIAVLADPQGAVFALFQAK